MKQLSTSSRAIRLTAVLGLTGLLAGFVSATPAHADDDWHFHRYDAHLDYRLDRDAVRRDENLLHSLYNQKRDAQRNHDNFRVRSLNRRISDIRARLDTNRYELRTDRNRDRNRDRADWHGDHRP